MTRGRPKKLDKENSFYNVESRRQSFMQTHNLSVAESSKPNTRSRKKKVEIADDSVENNQEEVVTWPFLNVEGLDAGSMAQAGFFFTPALSKTRCVTCFACNIVLTDMDGSKNALAAHFESSPSCPWLIQKLTQLYRRKSSLVTFTDEREVESKKPRRGRKKARAAVDNSNAGFSTIVTSPEVVELFEDDKSRPMLLKRLFLFCLLADQFDAKSDTFPIYELAPSEDSGAKVTRKRKKKNESGVSSMELQSVPLSVFQMAQNGLFPSFNTVEPLIQTVSCAYCSEYTEATLLEKFQHAPGCACAATINDVSTRETVDQAEQQRLTVDDTTPTLKDTTHVQVVDIKSQPSDASDVSKVCDLTVAEAVKDELDISKQPVADMETDAFKLEQAQTQDLSVPEQESVLEAVTNDVVFGTETAVSFNELDNLKSKSHIDIQEPHHETITDGKTESPSESAQKVELQALQSSNQNSVPSIGATAGTDLSIVSALEDDLQVDIMDADSADLRLIETADDSKPVSPSKDAVIQESLSRAAEPNVVALSTAEEGKTDLDEEPPRATENSQRRMELGDVDMAKDSSNGRAEVRGSLSFAVVSKSDKDNSGLESSETLAGSSEQILATAENKLGPVAAPVHTNDSSLQQRNLVDGSLQRQSQVVTPLKASNENEYPLAGTSMESKSLEKTRKISQTLTRIHLADHISPNFSKRYDQLTTLSDAQLEMTVAEFLKQAILEPERRRVRTECQRLLGTVKSSLDNLKSVLNFNQNL